MVNSKEIKKILNKFWNCWESFKIHTNFKQSYPIHLWDTTLVTVLPSRATKNASAHIFLRMSGIKCPRYYFSNKSNGICT